jgi:hypothetical protein
MKVNIENKENYAQGNYGMNQKSDKTELTFVKSHAFKNSVTSKVNLGYANLPENFKNYLPSQSLANSSIKNLTESGPKPFSIRSSLMTSNEIQPVNALHGDANRFHPIKQQTTTYPDHLQQYIPTILNHYKVNSSKNKIDAHSISENWRHKNIQKVKLFEIIFNFCTYFGLKSRTFFTANNIFDRVMHSSDAFRNESMTLTALAAFFMAAKYEEIYPPAIGDVCKLLHDKYTKESILEMESKILLVIQFNMVYVSPLDAMELIANQWDIKCPDVLQMATFVISVFCFDISIDIHNLFKLAIFALSTSMRITKDQFLFKADSSLSSEENYHFLKAQKKIIALIEEQKIVCFSSQHGSKFQRLKSYVLDKISG